MTKQEILDYFKDINEAYNNCNMFDSLSAMLDELMESKPQIVHCKDCRFYIPHPHIDLLGYCCGACGELASVDSDWFCGSWKQKEGERK